MFGLVFRLPFWIYFLLAAGMVYLTEQVIVAHNELEREKRAALIQGAPEPVKLAEFRKDRDIALAGEVNVSGRIDFDYTSHLIKTKNGEIKGERDMYVLFAAEEEADTNIARAAIVLPEADGDRFFDALDQYATGFTETDVIFTINGKASSQVALSDVAFDALDDYGITRAPDFFFLTPYLQGREAALASSDDAAMDYRLIGYGIAFILGMMGLIRFRASKARRNRKASTEQGADANEVPSQGQQPQQIQMRDPLSGAYRPLNISPSVAPNSPLGRIAQRQQGLATAGAPSGATQNMLPAAPVAKGSDRKSPGWLIPLFAIGVAVAVGYFAATHGLLPAMF